MEGARGPVQKEEKSRGEEDKKGEDEQRHDVTQVSLTCQLT